MSAAIDNPETSSDRSRFSVPTLFWVVFGVVVAAHAPLMYLHCTQMWQKSYYQYLPLIPIGAFFLAAPRLKELDQPLEPGHPLVTWPLVLLSAAGLAAAAFRFSPWAASVATMITLLAMIHGIGGWRLVASMLPVWIFCGLVVPIPFDQDRALVTWLQQITATWSSNVLDVLRVLHRMDGVVVEIGGRRLMVEEACSGIQSLFAALTCTLFFVVWARRPAIRATLLVLLAVFWVMMANIMRVVVIAFVMSRFGVDLSHDWEGYWYFPHTALGLVIFGFTFLMILSTDRLHMFFTPGPFLVRHEEWVEERLRRSESPNSSLTAHLPSLNSTWLASVMTIFVYGGVLGYQVTALDPSVFRVGRVAFADLGEEFLPAAVGPWKRVGYQKESRDAMSQLGEFSQVWRYQTGNATVSASLDYPFVGWHELSVCYRNTGWSIDKIETITTTPDGGPSDPYVEMEISKKGGLTAFVLFALNGDDNTPVPPPGSVLNQLSNRINVRPTYQMQVFASSYAALAPEMKVEARKLFLTLRQKWATANDSQPK